MTDFSKYKNITVDKETYSTITKLQTILKGESEVELKTKISETINKIKGEEFNQMNYVRISSLEKSI